MKYYIGLDVSQRQTSICIVDERGKALAEGKALTTPEDIHGWIFKHTSVRRGQIKQVGLEAGAMSSWLYTEMQGLGLPMICLETLQAHRFLKTCRNKTDRNDAQGLAQLVRMGGAFIQAVAIRRQTSQELRTLLTLRQMLVGQKISLENNISGCLKPFGLIVPRGGVKALTFEARVNDAVQKGEDKGVHLRAAVTASLKAYSNICEQLDVLTGQIEEAVRQDPVCRRLMTAPGVGHIIALSFMTAVDDPKRFATGDDIGAYFGLAPKQYQSGETDIRMGISKMGNSMTRSHLVQAATVVLYKCKKWSSLRAWGMKVAKRRGSQKARVAVARKLAVILHRMWVNETDFRWGNASDKESASVTTGA